MKMENKLWKTYLRYYNLLIAQGLWQARYQVLSKVFLKELKELNLNTDMMIENVKLVELNISIMTAFLSIQKIKDDLIEYKCLICNRNFQIKFDE